MIVRQKCKKALIRIWMFYILLEDDAVKFTDKYQHFHFDASQNKSRYKKIFNFSRIKSEVADHSFVV